MPIRDRQNRVKSWASYCAVPIEIFWYWQAKEQLRMDEHYTPPIRSRRRYLPLFNIWVLFAAMIIACLLTMVTFGGLFLSRLGDSPPPPSTAILVILPAATFTPTVEGGLAATPGGPDQTLPAPPPGEIALGGYVQVTGTGGTGLRLRDQPGLNSEIRMVVSDAEVFLVQEGPVDLDGYLWWRLVGPFDDTRQGWAVSNYLNVIQNP